MEAKKPAQERTDIHEAIAHRSIILTAANPKGGVGKTTLSVGLYGAAIECGLPVTLIDTDVGQNSAKKWLKDDRNVLAVSPNNIHEILSEQNNRLLIIDTAGSSNPSIDRILIRSDFVLIPISDSPLERVTGVEFYKRLYNAQCNAYFVFAGIDRSGSTRSNVAQQAIRLSHRMSTVIPRRVSAKDAAAMHVIIQSVRDSSKSSLSLYLGELFQEIISTVLINRARGGRFNV